MGLAGPKKRTKISHDPNNTQWSRSTTNYGHKIMASQGWKPGNFLGVQNSSHAEHFTAASASHIRISLKDDTLGLGAKPRRPLTDDEPTGLDAFQGLLGRLNGKSDAELEKEERVKLDIKAMSYIERRWKSMHFISGGLLSQEKQPESTKLKVEESEGVKSDKKEKREKKSKKEKKEKKDKKEKSEKKEKSKDKKKKRRDKSSSEEDTEQDSSSKSRSASGSEAKNQMSDSDAEDDEEDNSTIKQKSKSKKRKRKEDATEQTQPKKSDSTGEKPSVVVKTKEQIPLARQVIRSRYIQQKKRALMDAKSLNEIFMIAS